MFDKRNKAGRAAEPAGRRSSCCLIHQNGSTQLVLHLKFRICVLLAWNCRDAKAKEHSTHFGILEASCMVVFGTSKSFLHLDLQAKLSQELKKLAGSQSGKKGQRLINVT